MVRLHLSSVGKFPLQPFSPLEVGNGLGHLEENSLGPGAVAHQRDRVARVCGLQGADEHQEGMGRAGMPHHVEKGILNLLRTQSEPLGQGPMVSRPDRGEDDLGDLVRGEPALSQEPSSTCGMNRVYPASRIQRSSQERTKSSSWSRR